MSDYTLNSFDGYILAVEEKRLLMKRDCSWGTEEMIVTIAENTKILDTENGYPLLAGSLKMGMPIRAYVGETMTMSLPPIVNGVMILCGISTDYSFPMYTAVKASNFEEDRIGMVVVIDGMEIYVDENTILLPYLTRNLIRMDDLTPGRRFLIWPDAENASRAQKIILFMD